jgi:hypothetical protein
MTWGHQRQIYIISGIALIIIVPIMVFLAVTLYEEPTCFDGKQNGTENGIDCGGECQLVCRNSTVSIFTIWSRVFAGENGVSGSALLENKNTRAIAVDVPYKFSIFKGEIELSSVEGLINIPPKKRIPLIIEGLEKGVQEVDYHTLEIGEPREWVYEQGEKSPFLISQQVIEEKDGLPIVSARVKNLTFDEVIQDSYFVVFVYDEFDTVIGQSTTYIKELKPEETKDIAFTWREKFDSEVIRFDVFELNK